MAFKDFPEQRQGVMLLQRSLERGRLAHAYLFSGHEMEQLEALTRTLAKTLNCLNPARAKNGMALDCCDRCLNCRKIQEDNHADVFWIRPESKMRQIKIEQITHRDDSPPRVMNEFVNLKPTEAEYKIGIIAGADRMNANAANAFLKTLEEPPPKSILILLTTEPQRVLETILSRCLRLNFSADAGRRLSAEDTHWIEQFSQIAAGEQKSLLGRYRLLDVMLQKLNGMKAAVEEDLRTRSPLERYEDVEKELADKWEEELKASVEAEYRRQRADLLLIFQRWLRDVWLQSQSAQSSGGKPDTGLLDFPQMEGTCRVAQKISAADALANLQVMEETQRLLHTNVQEALTLEVGLLKLRL